MITSYIILILSILFRYFQFYNIVDNNTLLCYAFVLVIFFLSFIKILNLRFNKKMFVTALIILSISFTIFFLNTDDNLFIYGLIALAFIDIDNKKLIKVFFITSLTMYITTITLNQLGIISSNDILRDGDVLSSIRYSLGFGHVNSVFLYYLPIAYSGFYLFHEHKIYKWLVLAAAIILFILSNCRTGLVFSLVFFFLMIIKDKKIIDYLAKILKYLFPILTVASIVAVLLWGSSKNNSLNLLLSNRLSNAFFYIKNGYLFSFFGNNIANKMALDNLYINLLVTLGIFSYFLYWFLYQKGASLIKDKKLVIITLLYLLYGLSEANTTGNFMLIIFIKEILLNAKNEDFYGQN